MRGRHRKKPEAKKPEAKKPIVPKPKPEKPQPKPEKPLVEEEETRGRRVAKALKKGAAAPGLKTSDSGDASEAAGAAELTALRLRKQRSTPGKAQSIIKNRRV